MKPSGKYLNLGDKVQTYINYSNKFLIIQYVFNQTPFYDKVVSLDYLNLGGVINVWTTTRIQTKTQTENH